MSIMREQFADSRAAPIKIAINMFSLMDGLNGEWHQGPDGEYYCVGGLYHNTAFAGGPNVGKTGVAVFFTAKAMTRIPVATGHAVDSENTLPAHRINRTAKAVAKAVGHSFTVYDPEDPDAPDARFDLLDGRSLYINEWFDKMLMLSGQRLKERSFKKNQLTCEFLTDKGGQVITNAPFIALLDSWTEAQVEGADKLAVTEGVDDPSGNTEYMYEGRIKGRILSQSPRLQTQGDIFCIYTASIDEKVEMGGRPGQPPKKQMSHMDGGLSLKKVSNQFKKMTTNLWWLRPVKTMYKGTGSADKVPKFPYDQNDLVLGNTDLEYGAFSNLRGKSGVSGQLFELIRSQRDGLLPELSNAWFLMDWGTKEIKNFGISDAGQYQYVFDLYPDVKWRYTTVRKLLEDDYRMAEAVELTTMLKIAQHVTMEPLFHGLICTPAELYRDIKALGYDWNILLDTRYWWTYRELAKDEKPFLSILDLLRMRKGLYHPKWYTQPLTPTK